jgi:hypothetical protein
MNDLHYDDSKSVMWQLSFPMSEEEAKKLSAKGLKHLKKNPGEHSGTILFPNFSSDFRSSGFWISCL